MKKAVKRWIAISLGFITSLVISYCIGTFQPNWMVLEELKAEASAQMVKDYNSLGLEKPSIKKITIFWIQCFVVFGFITYLLTLI